MTAQKNSSASRPDYVGGHLASPSKHPGELALHAHDVEIPVTLTKNISPGTQRNVTNKDLKLPPVGSDQGLLQKEFATNFQWNFSLFRVFWISRQPGRGVHIWLPHRLACAVNSSLALIIVFLEWNPGLSRAVDTKLALFHVLLCHAFFIFVVGRHRKNMLKPADEVNTFSTPFAEVSK